MLSRKKGFISIVILFIITIAIVGGGAYYLTTKHGTETLTPLEEITLDPDRPMLRDRTQDTPPPQSQPSQIARNITSSIPSTPSSRSTPPPPTIPTHPSTPTVPTTPTTPNVVPPTMPTPQLTNPIVPTSSVNVAPVITPMSTIAVNIGQLIQFTVTASDSNGDILTYSAGTLPTGASFNSSSHVFTWTPTAEGTNTIVFKVSDGRLESTISVQMIVSRQTRPPIENTNPVVRPPTLTPRGSDFKIFDAVGRYEGKPSPMIPGLEIGSIGWGPCFIFLHCNAPSNEAYLASRVPNEEATREYAHTLPQGAYSIIDIEHWPVDISTSSPAEVNLTIQNFKNIISWMRSERPDLKIGIYGVIPNTNYWAPKRYRQGLDALHYLANGGVYADFPWAWARGGVASPTGDWGDSTTWRVDPTKEWSVNYAKWQAANDYVAPLAQSVDFIVPEVYTYYGLGHTVGNEGDTLTQSWEWFAEESMKEAKQYGKPVYPILWPRYFDAPHDLIEAPYFREQIDFIKTLGVNGMIIWEDGGDYHSNGPWREFPWVTELKDFVQDNNIGSNNLNAAALNAITMHEEEFWLSLYIAITALLGLYIELRWLTYRKTSKRE